MDRKKPLGLTDLSALPATAVPRVAGFSADERNDEAVRLLELGDIEAGERFLAEALALDPLHPEAVYNDAILRFGAGGITDDEALRAVSNVHESAGRSARTALLCAALAEERGDAGTSVEVSIPTGHGWVLGLKPFRDGEAILSTGEDGVLRVWQPRTGVCLFRLAGHESWITDFDATPDGLRAVTASYDGTVRVWDLTIGQCVGLLSGHQGYVAGVRLRKDGRAMTVGIDRTARLWDLDTFECLHVARFAELSGYPKVAIAPDAGVFAMTTGYPRVDVWDFERGDRLAVLEGHESYASAVAITPDGGRLLVGSSRGPARVWDLHARAPMCDLEGHPRGITAVAIDPAAMRAATGEEQGSIRIWDIPSCRCLRTFGRTDESVDAISIAPGGKRVFAGYHGGNLRIFRLGNPKRARFARSPARPADERASAIRAFESAIERAWQSEAEGDIPAALSALREARSEPSLGRHPAFRALAASLRPRAALGPLVDVWRESVIDIRAWSPVALSPDGKRLYGRAPGGDHAVWDLDTMNRTPVPLPTDSDVMVLTATDRTLFMATKDGAFHIASRTGKISSFGPGVGSSCFAATADDSRFVAGREGATVVVCDTETGQTLRTFEWQHHGGIHTVATSADGRIIVSASSDRIVVWDAPGGSARVLCTRGSRAALTEDGALALVAGDDGVVELRDARTGQARWTFREREERLDMAMTPDGLAVASIGRDLRLHDVRTGHVIRVLHRREAAYPHVAIAADASRVVTADGDRVFVYRLDWDLVPGVARGPIPTAVPLPELPPPAPVPRPRAWLVPIAPTLGARHLLGEVTIIGRDDGQEPLPDTILLDHGTVARRHAMVRHHQGTFWIMDTKSHCGTMINDAPGPVRHPLAPGDVVGIGQVRLRFESDGGNG